MSHAATNWAIRQRGLKPAAKIVLWHLADCHNPSNGCFPTQAYLAEASEMSRSTVNLHLDALEGLGLIRREPDVDPQNKRQRPTQYHLNMAEPVSGFETQAVSGFETRAVSEKTPEPCPILAESRVLNPDRNLVIDKPVKEEPVITARKRSAPRTRIPVDAIISPEMQKAAEKKGLSVVEAEAQFVKFRDWALAKGQAYADWNAAWRNWLTSDFYKPITGNVHPLRNRGSNGPTLDDYLDHLKAGYAVERLE